MSLSVKNFSKTVKKEIFLSNSVRSLTVFLSYRFIHPFKCFELRSFKQSLFSWYRLKNFHKNAINALERCV